MHEGGIKGGWVSMLRGACLQQMLLLYCLMITNRTQPPSLHKSVDLFYTMIDAYIYGHVIKISKERMREGVEGDLANRTFEEIQGICQPSFTEVKNGS